MSVEAYQAEVSLCAKQRTDKNIPNSSLAHAKIGIEALISIAEGHIRILSKTFNHGFWKGIVDKLVKFLKDHPNGKVDILVTEKDSESLMLIGEKFAGFQDRVRASVLNKEQLEKHFPGIEIPGMPNFMVVDPIGFRYELSDKELAQSLVSGVMNFGNAEVSNNLRTAFDQLREFASSPTGVPAAA